MQTGVTESLRVNGLSYSYGAGSLARAVLKGVSFSVCEGEVIIITGPSGSGKTTLLTIIGAMRPFGEGSVHFQGHDLAGMSESRLLDVRQRIGFVFQRHNLLKSLPVIENVESGLHLLPETDREMNRMRAEAMLEAVGLGGRGADYPENLSGGQQQRVAVARALVRMPDMIVADEPTAALDAESGRKVMEVVRSVASQLGCTVLISTHDERIFDIADRRLHIEDGVLKAVH
ncbi:MAG: ATP-binding cassette domain-containing protein [Alphaproteobacteria bacterium]|nr:ATP-binding cassette domain-containing protein [Alphaproteobacteria bacterium]MBU0799213.1 ATP-binding cassette domain-containing protein [Alphaproteobacteria bacterium]MBU0887536.1 ATP-binding cassette domain-containing protein [Alphaproteobacteria bacterium]MBU1814773.1 ATP-binding cassette domain-containing protein [Alphaproteobacteria bacterium]MBU2090827.1 ATP-binding cassette domain-containing protein [Alphaproteobacteria bacterium]